MDPRLLSPADFDAPDEMQMEIYRNMTESQRLLVAFDLWESCRELMVGFVRSDHPDWSEEEIQMETGRRMLRGI